MLIHLIQLGNNTPLCFWLLPVVLEKFKRWEWIWIILRFLSVAVVWRSCFRALQSQSHLPHSVICTGADVAHRVYVTWHRCYGSVWNRASKVDELKHNFGWEDCVILTLHSKAVKRQSWCFKLAHMFWNCLLHPYWHASTCALINSSLIQQKWQVYLIKHEVNQRVKLRRRWIIDDSLP